MRLNIKELIVYFDIKKSSDYGDTTGTISVVGEDLNSAIFKHYCEKERGSEVEILDSNICIPVQLKKVGKHLDRWIVEKRTTENILYQTEVKSWCSRAIGGVNIPLNIEDTELSRLANVNWQSHIKTLESDEKNGLNKVFIDMISDKNLDLKYNYKKEPLLLFWDARKPIGENNYFFKYILPTKYFDFDYTWVFSCSLYLRKIYNEGTENISLGMPNASRRIEQLNRIFKI